MPAEGQNWTCPYCGHAQVISEQRYHAGIMRMPNAPWKGKLPAVNIVAIACANAKCSELTIKADLYTYQHAGGGTYSYSSPIKEWPLLPPSSAKPQPDYIPAPIRLDYEEACAIRDLSPKASATITRRCIQGMIRDFCGISKHRLIDEIKELRTRVETNAAPKGVQEDTVDAIDHVRSIGNIGAHMEADINVIVDVEPGEAQLLIDLVELLFAEWYVARERRTQRLIGLGALAQEKKADKAPKVD